MKNVSIEERFKNAVELFDQAKQQYSQYLSGKATIELPDIAVHKNSLTQNMNAIAELQRRLDALQSTIGRNEI